MSYSQKPQGPGGSSGGVGSGTGNIGGNASSGGGNNIIGGVSGSAVNNQTSQQVAKTLAGIQQQMQNLVQHSQNALPRTPQAADFNAFFQQQRFQSMLKQQQQQLLLENPQLQQHFQQQMQQQNKDRGEPLALTRTPAAELLNKTYQQHQQQANGSSTTNPTLASVNQQIQQQLQSLPNTLMQQIQAYQYQMQQQQQQQQQQQHQQLQQHAQGHPPPSQHQSKASHAQQSALSTAAALQSAHIQQMQQSFQQKYLAQSSVAVAHSHNKLNTVSPSHTPPPNPIKPPSLPLSTQITPIPPPSPVQQSNNVQSLGLTSLKMPSSSPSPKQVAPSISLLTAKPTLPPPVAAHQNKSPPPVISIQNQYGNMLSKTPLVSAIPPPFPTHYQKTTPSVGSIAGSDTGMGSPNSLSHSSNSKINSSESLKIQNTPVPLTKQSEKAVTGSTTSKASTNAPLQKTLNLPSTTSVTPSITKPLSNLSATAGTTDTSESRKSPLKNIPVVTGSSTVKASTNANLQKILNLPPTTTVTPSITKSVLPTSVGTSDTNESRNSPLLKNVSVSSSPKSNHTTLIKNEETAPVISTSAGITTKEAEPVVPMNSVTPETTAIITPVTPSTAKIASLQSKIEDNISTQNIQIESATDQTFKAQVSSDNAPELKNYTSPTNSSASEKVNLQSIEETKDILAPMSTAKYNKSNEMDCKKSLDSSEIKTKIDVNNSSYQANKINCESVSPKVESTVDFVETNKKGAATEKQPFVAVSTPLAFTETKPVKIDNKSDEKMPINVDEKCLQDTTPKSDIKQRENPSNYKSVDNTEKTCSIDTNIVTEDLAILSGKKSKEKIQDDSTEKNIQEKPEKVEQKIGEKLSRVKATVVRQAKTSSPLTTVTEKNNEKDPAKGKLPIENKQGSKRSLFREDKKDPSIPIESEPTTPIEANSLSDNQNKRHRLKTILYQSPLPELAFITKLSASEASCSPKPIVVDDKLIVFYKNEYMAVRNAESGFFLCQTLQNVYRSSPKISIRWLSEDKNDNTIYIPDFYDHTDIECVLTTVNLKRVDKGHFRLPTDEKIRIENILKKAIDVEKGLAPRPDITEENPDGLDISLYKYESQIGKKSSSNSASISGSNRKKRSLSKSNSTKKRHGTKSGSVQKSPNKKRKLTTKKKRKKTSDDGGNDSSEESDVEYKPTFKKIAIASSTSITSLVKSPRAQRSPLAKARAASPITPTSKLAVNTKQTLNSASGSRIDRAKRRAEAVAATASPVDSTSASKKIATSKGHTAKSKDKNLKNNACEEESAEVSEVKNVKIIVASRKTRTGASGHIISNAESGTPNTSSASRPTRSRK